ncbi:MAG: hypothetical protein R3275_04950 [Saprospiraceae bacterium]|nr:hypothetical protein [Saprospiraceae bacterium]
MSHLHKISCFFLILLIMASCSKGPVTVDRDMRRTIDTLYRNKASLITQKTDSLCKIKRDSLYPVWLDSVLKQRKLERERILDKRR